MFGLSVNYRFLDETITESVRGFCRARTELPAPQ